MNPISKLEILARQRAALTAVAGTAARSRIEQLFDEDTFVELDNYAGLGTGNAGVITGYGQIDGLGAYVFSQDISVQSGAVDRIHARKIQKVYELATMTGLPIIGIYDSNGAKLDDMPEAMEAYGEMISASNRISGVVPQVALVLGTCPGMAALAACGADLLIMCEGAEFFMNSPRVAKANGTYVDGAGTAENTAKSGVAHLVGADEAEAILLARQVLPMFPQNNLSGSPEFSFKEPTGYVKPLRDFSEEIEQVDMREVIPHIVDAGSVFELSQEYGVNAMTALATLGGSTVLAIGASKTLGIDECSKIAYFVNLADAFSIPVVTFINTDGFSPYSKDELAGSIRQAAKLSHVYTNATVPKVALLVGKAYGSSYVTLAGKSAGADLVIAWPSAIISALPPTTAVAFLAGDQIDSENSREDVEEQYKISAASPFRYASEGYVDQVIDPAQSRQSIAVALDMLAGKRVNQMAKKHSNIPL